MSFLKYIVIIIILYFLYGFANCGKTVSEFELEFDLAEK